MTQFNLLRSITLYIFATIAIKWILHYSICHSGNSETLIVVDIKIIKSVVAIVPDYQITVESNIIVLENMFSLVESPFLKFAILFGTLGDDNNTIDNVTDTID